jgi:hypothetical protein
MEQEANKKILENLTAALARIHSDYKKDGIIMSLRSYDEEGVITYGYLRKMTEMEIIVNIGTGKRNARYKWNREDNPDYEELAQNILDYTPNRNLPKSEGVNKISPEVNLSNPLSRQTYTNAVIGLTLELHKLGFSEEAIKKRVPDLLAALSNKF